MKADFNEVKMMLCYFTDKFFDLLSNTEDIKDLWIQGNEYYHHKTLYVDNLLSYIKIINSMGEMRRKNEMFLDLLIYYRGMENYKWMLNPSIVVNHYQVMKMLCT